MSIEKDKNERFVIRYGKLYLHRKAALFTNQFHQARQYKTQYRAQKWITQNMTNYIDRENLYIEKCDEPSYQKGREE